MNVAPKKVLNGTKKCPQEIPARSKSGLGILAISRTMINPWVFNLIQITYLAFSKTPILS